MDTDCENDTKVIYTNHKAVTVNPAATEIDLLGRLVLILLALINNSGVRRQMDFMAVAALTKRDNSKTMPILKNSIGVVTTKTQVHHGVKEFEVSDLFIEI
ncbi:MAG: acetyl-CoA hydrolase/transferase C-terminal domain-containing protein [Bacteroidota bacterium]|nr:acetyl-CoA hydrolase/transferase C-terminal domain-containing protein [Bacteroidota bacterium]